MSERVVRRAAKCYSRRVPGSIEEALREALRRLGPEQLRELLMRPLPGGLCWSFSGREATLVGGHELVEMIRRDVLTRRVYQEKFAGHPGPLPRELLGAMATPGSAWLDGPLRIAEEPPGVTLQDGRMRVEVPAPLWHCVQDGVLFAPSEVVLADRAGNPLVLIRTWVTAGVPKAYWTFYPAVVP